MHADSIARVMKTTPGVLREGRCSGYAGSGEEDRRLYPQLRLCQASRGSRQKRRERERIAAKRTHAPPE